MQLNEHALVASSYELTITRLNLKQLFFPITKHFQFWTWKVLVFFRGKQRDLQWSLTPGNSALRKSTAWKNWTKETTGYVPNKRTAKEQRDV